MEGLEKIKVNFLDTSTQAFEIEHAVPLMQVGVSLKFNLKKLLKDLQINVMRRNDDA